MGWTDREVVRTETSFDSGRPPEPLPKYGYLATFGCSVTEGAQAVVIENATDERITGPMLIMDAMKLAAQMNREDRDQEIVRALDKAEAAFDTIKYACD